MTRRTYQVNDSCDNKEDVSFITKEKKKAFSINFLVLVEVTSVVCNICLLKHRKKRTPA